MIQIFPLTGMSEVEPGDSLAGMLAAAARRAGIAPARTDILVVTQKIVSKAEARFVALENVTPGPQALELAAITGKDARLVELVLMESVAVVRAAPNVLITRHRSGLVMANAGIDRSNLGPGRDDAVLLLPLDADASAQQLRDALARFWPEAPAVLVSDSFGRPWRYGVVNVAIGASGLPALIDRRGELDRDGRRLEVTQVALADMIASAAGLATGEGAEGVPAAIIRGISPTQAPDLPATALVRPLAADLFQ